MEKHKLCPPFHWAAMFLEAQSNFILLDKIITERPVVVDIVAMEPVCLYLPPLILTDVEELLVCEFMCFWIQSLSSSFRVRVSELKQVTQKSRVAFSLVIQTVFSTSTN